MSEHAIDNAILSVLSEGEPLAGYGIVKRVEERSGGRIKLATGTLFPAIERLLDAGRIRVSERADEDFPDRRYYEPAPAHAEASGE